MIRITNTNLKKRRNLLKLSKFFKGCYSRLYRKMKEQIKQSLYRSYIGRKLKKRNFKTLWIYRINAALKNNNNKYSIFIGLLKKINIFINKKMLSIIAYTNLSSFYMIEKIVLNYFSYLKKNYFFYYNYIKFLI
jgi:large subunit ribosomal protein L20